MAVVQLASTTDVVDALGRPILLAPVAKQAFGGEGPAWDAPNLERLATRVALRGATADREDATATTGATACGARATRRITERQRGGVSANTPTGRPRSERGFIPADSNASHEASRSSRCCGSIASASRGEMPKNAGSNSPAPARKPPSRLAGGRAAEVRGPRPTEQRVERVLDRARGTRVRDRGGARHRACTTAPRGRGGHTPSHGGRRPGRSPQPTQPTRRPVRARRRGTSRRPSAAASPSSGRPPRSG